MHFVGKTKKCEIITRNQTPHDKDEPINFFHGENIHTVYLKLARKALWTCDKSFIIQLL